MKIQITIIFLLASISIFSQTTENYYKDSKRKKTTVEKKAKYKEQIIITDSTKSVTVTCLKTGVEISQENYLDKNPHGIWQYSSDDGSNKWERDFSKLIYSQEKIEGGHYFSTKDTVELDFEPAFYNSESEFYNYLGVTVRYPELARETGIQGKVYIHLKIDSTGKCTPIGVYKGAHYLLDLEALRVFEIMPNWTPALKDGIKIDSYTIIPISFRIG